MLADEVFAEVRDALDGDGEEGSGEESEEGCGEDLDGGSPDAKQSVETCAK